MAGRTRQAPCGLALASVVLVAGGSCSAGIDAAAGAGFPDYNSAERWQQRFQLIPQPLCNHFAGGIVEAGDVVEVIVVEAGDYRLHCCLDVGIVHYPAQ